MISTQLLISRDLEGIAYLSKKIYRNRRAMLQKLIDRWPL
jgi:hypothetical protein